MSNEKNERLRAEFDLFLGIKCREYNHFSHYVFGFLHHFILMGTSVWAPNNTPNVAKIQQLCG